MNENEKSRSGLQTAVDFAHAARAAKRIMQAAAASGVHGAAAATAREAFPLLLKVLIAVLVVFIAVPIGASGGCSACLCQFNRKGNRGTNFNLLGIRK